MCIPYMLTVCYVGVGFPSVNSVPPYDRATVPEDKADAGASQPGSQ